MQTGEWNNEEFVRVNIRGWGTTHGGEYTELSGDAFPLASYGDQKNSILKESDSPAMLFLLSPVIGKVGEIDNPTLDSWGGRFRHYDRSKFPNYYVDLDNSTWQAWETVYKWRVAFLADWKQRWTRYGNRPAPDGRKLIGQSDLVDIPVQNAKGYAGPPPGSFPRRPDGTAVKFRGFHDEGALWRIRFTPDQIGTWKYTARFSDGTPGADGSFECIRSATPGMISRDTKNPRWFGFSSGRHVVIRSFHASGLSAGVVRRRSEGVSRLGAAAGLQHILSLRHGGAACVAGRSGALPACGGDP